MAIVPVLRQAGPAEVRRMLDLTIVLVDRAN
jgi:hypothetical protein